MNMYELTLITANKKDMQVVAKLVTDFVKKVKGKVKKEEDWGERALAYPIKKNKTGVYQHYVLELPPAEQPKLMAELKIQENLLRSLAVRVE